MGRASRNLNGRVLLFADKMTDSLEKALAETKRRRGVQEAFNTEHGIIPKSVSRKLEEDLRIQDPLGELWAKDKGDTLSETVENLDDLATIEELEAKMQAAAARLDFEEAARLRDLIRSKS